MGRASATADSLRFCRVRDERAVLLGTVVVVVPCCLLLGLPRNPKPNLSGRSSAWTQRPRTPHPGNSSFGRWSPASVLSSAAARLRPRGFPRWR
eukprot:jgi/Tetstr1/455121/TSEL_041973.t1